MNCNSKFIMIDTTRVNQQSLLEYVQRVEFLEIIIDIMNKRYSL